jgi:hypothetical protein
VRSGVCLSIAFLVSTGIIMAANDPSGRWAIKYEGQLDDQLASGGTIYISKAGSTVHGGSTLGLRGDGSMIGLIS